MLAGGIRETPAHGSFVRHKPDLSYRFQKTFCMKQYNLVGIFSKYLQITVHENLLPQ
jgi:hypothetical protein